MSTMAIRLVVLVVGVSLVFDLPRFFFTPKPIHHKANL